MHGLSLDVSILLNVKVIFVELIATVHLVCRIVMLLMGTAIIACLCSASSALSVGEESVTIETLVGRLNAAEQAININQQELM